MKFHDNVITSRIAEEGLPFIQATYVCDEPWMTAKLDSNSIKICGLNEGEEKRTKTDLL